jgi:hypothetical protein
MQHERNIMHRQKSNDEHVLVITFLCLLGGIGIIETYQLSLFTFHLSPLIYHHSLTAELR